MLSQEIKKRVIDAMKRKDEVERDVLRVALGDIQSEAARAGRDLDDQETMRVLRKVLKGIDETMVLVKDADARHRLEQEKVVIESLLPRTLSVEQIIASLAPVADAIRAAGSDGQATGIAIKHLKSTAQAVDGKDAAEAVKRLRAE